MSETERLQDIQGKLITDLFRHLQKLETRITTLEAENGHRLNREELERKYPTNHRG